MQNAITAIILAGGQGRRFDYQDKGLVRWQEKYLVSHIIERLQAQVEQFIISCNRNQQTYQQMGHRICSDQLADFQGPLAGLQAALALSETRYTLVCPCDTPSLPDNLVDRLLQCLLANKAAVVYAHDGQRDQFLVAMYDTATPQFRQSLDRYLDSGKRNVRGWYNEHNAIACDLSDQASNLINVNSAADLARLSNKPS